MGGVTLCMNTNYYEFQVVVNLCVFIVKWRLLTLEITIEMVSIQMVFMVMRIPFLLAYDLYI